MKSFFSIVILVFQIFTTQAQAKISTTQLYWLMSQQNLQDSLKDQTILSMFENDQLCRASFCYEYIICSVNKITGVTHTQAYFTVTTLLGSEIFFQKTPLTIKQEVFSELPILCVSM